MTAPSDPRRAGPGSPAFCILALCEPDSQAEEGCLRRRPGDLAAAPPATIAATPHEAFEHGWSPYIQNM